jgi:hypothetical protein
VHELADALDEPSSRTLGTKRFQLPSCSEQIDQALVDAYLPCLLPHNPAASSAAANNRKKIVNSPLSPIDPFAPSLTPDKQAEGARA